MSPKAQEKRKERCVYTARRKKENKCLTDGLNSTFIEELESNSKSSDHCHLVRQIVDLVVEIHRIAVEVEVETILEVVGIVVRN
jgi:hypothetical protein